MDLNPHWRGYRGDGDLLEADVPAGISPARRSRSSAITSRTVLLLLLESQLQHPQRHPPSPRATLLDVRVTSVQMVEDEASGTAVHLEARCGDVDRLVDPASREPWWSTPSAPGMDVGRLLGHQLRGAVHQERAERTKQIAERADDLDIEQLHRRADAAKPRPGRSRPGRRRWPRPQRSATRCAARGRKRRPVRARLAAVPRRSTRRHGHRPSTGPSPWVRATGRAGRSGQLAGARHGRCMEGSGDLAVRLESTRSTTESSGSPPGGPSLHRD